MDGRNGQETITQRVICISDLIEVWRGVEHRLASVWARHEAWLYCRTVQALSRLHQHGHGQCLNKTLISSRQQ